MTDQTMIEWVARAMARANFSRIPERDIDSVWQGWVPDAEAAMMAMRGHLVPMIDGRNGAIPLTTAFVPLVIGHNQPCMSGDMRDRLNASQRRRFDDATRSVAMAIDAALAGEG